MAILDIEYYVAAEEAADFLKITTRRLMDLARADIIPAHPVDPNAKRKEWRFLLSELAAWMRGDKKGRKQ